jgi:hypothetical protein
MQWPVTFVVVLPIWCRLVAQPVGEDRAVARFHRDLRGQPSPNFEVMRTDCSGLALGSFKNTIVRRTVSGAGGKWLANGEQPADVQHSHTEQECQWA